ncbi:MAG TPA: hypothetical protein VJR89_22615 [Polyangiales bacterium]|nr:hypothetical protein [Polyangiales bacterium]
MLRQLQLGLVCALTFAAAGRARASCEELDNCLCDGKTLPQQHVLRGRIANLAGLHATIEVHDSLVDNATFAIKPGTAILGTLEANVGCGLPDPSFVPGDEVLALWQGPVEDALLRCDAYLSCNSEQCDAAGAGDALDENCHQSCLEASLEDCPDAFDRSLLVLIPWADTLDLGQGRELASDRAAVLGDSASCHALFPRPEPPPCDDVILRPVSEGCGVAGSRGASDTTGCALLLLWAASRVSRRSRKSVPR